MALKKTVATIHGFKASNAYHRIEGIRLIAKEKMAFQLRASKDGVLPHFSDESFKCDYDPTGNNIIAQAYVHLKTLPEFADAIDC